MQTQELTLEEVKKLELELLLFIDKICKEHHIPYYLSSGTLLGAVKYQGFIPWDDDIDIGMLREPQPARQKILCKRYSTKPIISRYQCAYLGLIPLGHRFPGRLGRYARRRA